MRNSYGKQAARPRKQPCGRELPTPKVAIIGYGSQGPAIAQNLQDAGFDIRVGLRPRSKSRRRAKADGISKVCGIGQAVSEADIVALAIPDHEHGRAFEEHLQAHLRSSRILWFLHGLSVHFGQVKVPTDCGVIMIAPHGPGPAVRQSFLEGRAFSAFFSVHQVPPGASSRSVRQIVNRLAEGIGVPKSKLIETTFAEEAVGDLFGEQSVLCGGLAMLIKSGFETLLSRGHDPDRAYLEVAYQLDLIVELIKQHGIEGMFERISVAAQFGSLEAGPKLINDAVRKRMDQVYDRIASGEFTRKLSDLDPAGEAALRTALKSLSHPALERAARKFSK